MYQVDISKFKLNFALCIYKLHFIQIGHDPTFVLMIKVGPRQEKQGKNEIKAW
jgi:hypothetical protein